MWREKTLNVFELKWIVYCKLIGISRSSVLYTHTLHQCGAQYNTVPSFFIHCRRYACVQSMQVYIDIPCSPTIASNNINKLNRNRLVLIYRVVQMKTSLVVFNFLQKYVAGIDFLKPLSGSVWARYRIVDPLQNVHKSQFRAESCFWPKKYIFQLISKIFMFLTILGLCVSHQNRLIFLIIKGSKLQKSPRIENPYLKFF